MKTKWVWALVIVVGLAGCTGSRGPNNGTTGSPSNPATEPSGDNAQAEEPSPTAEVKPAGNREGNGGDHVRATFLAMGKAIIEHLRHSGNGQNLVGMWLLDLNKLEKTLTVSRIKVQSQQLRDNGDSDVDATGDLDCIKLKRDVWMEHFEKERDVYYLVFHEMLRSAGYKDDNFIISKALTPFPKRERISTRVTPLFPLIPAELLSKVVQMDKLIFNGSGCPSKGAFYADFDVERNIFEFSSISFAIIVNRLIHKSLSRRNCDLSIPLIVPEGQRLVVSQLDVSARLGIAEGGSAALKAQAFLVGSPNKKMLVKRYLAGAGGINGRTLLRQNPAFSTPCGGSFLFRVHTAAEVDAPELIPSLVVVDRVAVYMMLEKCVGADENWRINTPEF